MNLYKPAWYLLGMATCSLLAGCDETPDLPSEWMSSPGTMGFINLDDVMQAFNQADNLQEFEKQVNRIYEGDGLVHLEGKPTSEGVQLVACEDIHWDEQKSCQNHDPLFSLLLAGGTAALVGSGVNQYYSQKWAYPVAGRQGMMLQQSGKPGSCGQGNYYVCPNYHYSTHWTSYTDPFDQRTQYRSSPQFIQQIQRNGEFENRMATAHGGKFTTSMEQISATRAKDIQVKARSSVFAQRLSKVNQNSGWGVRTQFAMQSGNGAYIPTKFSNSSRASSFSSSRGGVRVASGFEA